MLRRLVPGTLLCAVLVAGIALRHPARAQDNRCEERPIVCRMIKARLGEVSAAERVNPPGAQTLNYGDQPKQDIDFWPDKTTVKRPPLVAFIHGGAWTRGDKSNATGPAKVNWFTEHGYSFASINYRLVPNVRVEDQARDVAAALRFLRGQAATLGFDPDRIVLMGHSAGAHLAALVGTDERYLGVDLAAVRGVILLDGAAYDVPRQLKSAGRFEAKMYQQPFGTLDNAAQTLISPTAQAAAPNAAAFLIIFDAERGNAVSQSKALGAALERAGTAVALMPVKDSNHLRINFDVGKLESDETTRIAAFLAEQGLKPALQ